MRKASAQIDFDILQLLVCGKRIDCVSHDGLPLYARIIAENDIRAPGEQELLVQCNISCEWRGSKLGVLDPIDWTAGSANFEVTVTQL